MIEHTLWPCALSKSFILTPFSYLFLGRSDLHLPQTLLLWFAL
jgi:hypothetical protein